MKTRKKVLLALFAIVAIAMSLATLAGSPPMAKAEYVTQHRFGVEMTAPDGTSSLVGGYSLKLVSDDGSVEKNWTSQADCRILFGFEDGELGLYTGSVTGTPPEGYKLPDDVRFKVDTGDVYYQNASSSDWVMLDEAGFDFKLQRVSEKVRVEVGTRTTTNEFLWDEGESCLATITDESGQVVASPTLVCEAADEYPKSSVELEEGTYTLSLAELPDFVSSTQDAQFRLSKDDAGEWKFECYENFKWEEYGWFGAYVSCQVIFVNTSFCVYTQDNERNESPEGIDVELFRDGELFRSWTTPGRNWNSKSFDLRKGSYVLRVKSDLEGFVTPEDIEFEVLASEEDWAQDQGWAAVKHDGETTTTDGYVFSQIYYSEDYDPDYEPDSQWTPPYDWMEVVKAAIAAIGDSSETDPIQFISAVFAQAGDDTIGSSLDDLKSRDEDQILADSMSFGDPNITMSTIVFSEDGSRVGIYVGSMAVVEATPEGVKVSPLSDFSKAIEDGVCERWLTEKAPDISKTWTNPRFIVEGDVPEGMDALSFDVSYPNGLPIGGYHFMHTAKVDEEGNIDPNGRYNGVFNVDTPFVLPKGGVLNLPLSDEYTGLEGVSEGIDLRAFWFYTLDQSVVLDPIVPDGYGVEFTCDYDDTVVGADGLIHLNGSQGEGKGVSGIIHARFYKLSPAAFTIGKYSADPAVYSIDGDKGEDADFVGNPLEGATLAIYNAEGAEIEKWVSDAHDKSFDLLPGDYTVKELEAPDGYFTIDDVSIRVSDTGRIVMRDWGTWDSDDGLSFVLSQATFNDIDRELHLIDLAPVIPDPTVIDIVKYGVGAADDILADPDGAIIVPSSATPLAGASFHAELPDGTSFDAWTTGLAEAASGSEADLADATHELEIPEGVSEFYIIEDAPPEGYQLADRIHVSLGDDGIRYRYGDGAEFVSSELKVAILDIVESTPPSVEPEPTVIEPIEPEPTAIDPVKPEPTSMVTTGDAAAAVLAIAAMAAVVIGIRRRLR